MGKPRETRTLVQGCGFPRVGVRVALENPRVARRIPYVQLRSPTASLQLTNFDYGGSFFYSFFI